MELTAVQRVTAFVAVVLALAGLGAYLFLPSAAGAGQEQAGRSGSRTAPGAPAGGVRSTPAPRLPGGPGATTAAGPDIYAWLPFTQEGLASAARVATEFGADYGTFSYAKPVAAYLAPMRPIVTSQLAQLLGRAYSTPGLAAIRQADRQESAATAAITALRAFGQGSLTFVVAVTQRITSTKGTTTQVAEYAVTLTGSGVSWQVSDIEPAAAGNQ
jgi:hypothetical protein